MLFEFIALHRDEIIRRCRAKVVARSSPAPTKSEIDHGVPLFLDQLCESLGGSMTVSRHISESATLHGHDLLLQGFTIAQVVKDYGDVCQSITELAIETHASIETRDFRVLNECLDEAIASALTQFGEGTMAAYVAGEDKQTGFLVHELRNLINVAMIAAEVLKSGNVGVAGSTGAVLHRSLMGARDLIARSLAESRIKHGIQAREVLLVADLIQELLPSALLLANSLHIALTVLPVGADVAIEADRQVLSSVVLNLLQNAIKFTRPGTSVTLRVRIVDACVLIEVQDECGGLPNGDVDTVFEPFQQRGRNRSGLGLGLAFSRQAVEAANGRIYARDLPNNGCIFTVALAVVAIPVGAHDSH